VPDEDLADGTGGAAPTPGLGARAEPIRDTLGFDDGDFARVLYAWDFLRTFALQGLLATDAASTGDAILLVPALTASDAVSEVNRVASALGEDASPLPLREAGAPPPPAPAPADCDAASAAGDADARTLRIDAVDPGTMGLESFVAALRSRDVRG
jgi:hypothetical protein